MGKLMQNKT